MAQHQYALARYVALDRCLSRFRFNKDELIDYCSKAVTLVSGDERRLSEKTFYNDIRALREGVVLGRRAPIKCSEGRYHYDEPNFSLFNAGRIGVDLAQLDQRLGRIIAAAARAWIIVRDLDLPLGVKDQIRELLHSDEAVLLVLQHHNDARNQVQLSRKKDEEMTARELEEEQRQMMRTSRESLVATAISTGDFNELLLHVLNGRFGTLSSDRPSSQRLSRWKRFLLYAGYRRFYTQLRCSLS